MLRASADSAATKSIAVIHPGVGRRGSIPFRRGWQTQGPAYWALLAAGRRAGLDFVLAHRSAWDGRSRALRWAWTHDHRRWQLHGRTKFDAILPRANLHVRRAPPVVYWNDPRVWRVCADKWRTYERFRMFSPETWRVRTPAAVDRIRSFFPDTAFVLKPRFGRRARGVVFLRPRRPTSRVWREPMLLQRAIGGGAFGLWRKTVVDLRVYVQTGRLDCVYAKVGSTNNPILNVHRGSRVVWLTVAALPASARAFVRAIDRQFSDIRPRQYCVDFRYDERGRPRLIELNHLPVLPGGRGQDQARFYAHLCQTVRSQLIRGHHARQRHTIVSD